jgi:hypothetical protein
MATVDDYIAKRAESYGFITQTLDGLGLIDAIGGMSIANILASGVGTALQRFPGRPESQQ